MFTFKTNDPIGALIILNEKHNELFNVEYQISKSKKKKNILINSYLSY